MNGQPLPHSAHEAIALIPSGMFIMTASHDGRMAGVLVKLVQLCSPHPPQVAVAMLKGQSLEPLIRDSRSFTLCQISEDDRFLQKKFAPNISLPRTGRDAFAEHPIEDPFACIATRLARSGSPIIERAKSWLDCELVRSIELDGDHHLYVGRIIDGGISDAGIKPAATNRGDNT
jgi:flavin reductase (DIM6/NTAB) family NADH-FMN oxidoreductase RutF